MLPYRTHIASVLGTFLLAGAAPLACSLKSTVLCPPGQACAVLSGRVVDEKGGPVENANVTLVADAGPSRTVRTNRNGGFILDAVPTPPLVLGVQASGFARATRYLASNRPTDSLIVGLRPIDKTQSVVLAAVGGAAVSASTRRDEDGSTATLTIPAGAMVRADGAPAVGNANILLTYWSKTTNMGTIPGRLLATPLPGDQAPIRLETFGMADMEVVAADTGELLQVAPGTKLTWTVALSPAATANLAQRTSYVPLIKLYSLSPSTGLWVEEGTMQDGGLKYDGAGTFTSLLPHLSAYNLDGAVATGCIKGKITCGGTTAGTDTSMFIFDFDEVAHFTTVSDGKTGEFCFQVPALQAATSDAFYLVTGAKVGNTGNVYPYGSTETSCSPFETSCYSYINGQNPAPNPASNTLGADLQYQANATHGGQLNNVKYLQATRQQGQPDSNANMSLPHSKLPLAQIPECSKCGYYTLAADEAIACGNKVNTNCFDAGTIDLGKNCTSSVVGKPTCQAQQEGNYCNMNPGADDCCSGEGLHLKCSDFVCVLPQNVGQ